MTNFEAKFPTNAQNGDLVSDINGNVYQYNSATKSWSSKGVIPAPSIVSQNNAGLVTPSIYNRIKEIKDAIASGYNYSKFKIKPAINSYWYKLFSHNRTIRFIPESATDLRLEIDQAKLLGLLYRYSCPGDKGDVGARGKTGKTGIPGPNEIEYTPTLESDLLVIDADFVYDIDQPLSLRIYDDVNSAPYVEILINFDDYGLSFRDGLYNSSIDIDQSSISVDKENKKVTGYIKHARTWSTSVKWKYKIGQIGERGESGDPGSKFLKIKIVKIDDPYLASTDGLTSLRVGANSNLYYLISQLTGNNCVSKISYGNSGCNDIDFTSATMLSLVSLKKTSDYCKNIDKFTFGAIDPKTGVSNAADVYRPGLLDPDELLLPSWNPTEACWQQRHWSYSKFDWVGLTNVPKDDIGWKQPNTVESRNPSYPWGLQSENAPGERHCQDDFFFCANINDKKLPIVDPSGGLPVLQPLAVPELCCECDCPVELEVQRGYRFNDFVIGSDGELIKCGNEYSNDTQHAVCVLNGSAHLYRQRVFIPSSADGATVTVHAKVGYDSLCDENRDAVKKDEKLNRYPTFNLNCPDVIDKSNCPISWAMEIVETTGSVVANGPGYRESSSAGTKSISITGSGGYADINIYVNTKSRSCCLAYRVATSAGVSPPIFPESPSPSPSISLSPSVSQSTSPSVSPSFFPIESFVVIDADATYPDGGTYDFGIDDVGGSPEIRTFEIINNGNVPISINDIIIEEINGTA